jgi:DNA-binding LytR/AlgR family response regulator
MKGYKKRNNRKILIIDDNPAIHEDFKKTILGIENDPDIEDLEASLFGKWNKSRKDNFSIDSAFQGKEALKKVKQAVRESDPYAVAFVDVRMPPGWDGIETIHQIWKVDPDIEMVICTAYSDYSWDETVKKLGESDKLLILKKPFDNIEVKQLASALTAKWNLAKLAHLKNSELDKKVNERTAQLAQKNKDLEDTIKKLTEADKHIEQLHELLPICSYCQKIRNPDDTWDSIEIFMSKRLSTDLSHTICPDCYINHVKPQLDKIKGKKY